MKKFKDDAWWDSFDVYKQVRKERRKQKINKVYGNDTNDTNIELVQSPIPGHSNTSQNDK